MTTSDLISQLERVARECENAEIMTSTVSRRVGDVIKFRMMAVRALVSAEIANLRGIHDRQPGGQPQPQQQAGAAAGKSTAETVMVVGPKGQFQCELSGEGKCRECGSPIYWGHTSNGKSVPLQPQPNASGAYSTHFQTQCAERRGKG